MEYIENAETLKKFIEHNISTTCDNDKREASINWLAVGLARLVAKLHIKNIIHGDLTTSNVLIRGGITNVDDNKEDNDCLVLVDFGLARVESTVEDKAVDLYVLERSLISSHSELPSLFPAILSHYINLFGDKKQRSEIISKYNDVRARGRKRLMIGWLFITFINCLIMK